MLYVRDGGGGYVEFCNPTGKVENNSWDFSAAKAVCCQLKEEVGSTLDFWQDQTFFTCRTFKKEIKHGEMCKYCRDVQFFFSRHKLAIHGSNFVKFLLNWLKSEQQVVLLAPSGSIKVSLNINKPGGKFMFKRRLHSSRCSHC